VQLIPIPLSNWPSNDFRPWRFIVFGTAVNEIASLMQRGGFPNLLKDVIQLYSAKIARDNISAGFFLPMFMMYDFGFLLVCLILLQQTRQSLLISKHCSTLEIKKHAIFGMTFVTIAFNLKSSFRGAKMLTLNTARPNIVCAVLCII
jgi:hypothetical protein